MNGGTVIGNGLGGGVTFNRVTFDASGASLLGTQVAAGDWTVGTSANRVSGDGMAFTDPTGDLAFGALNIANDTGTGLYVNTKVNATAFALSNTSGTIDTTNGAAVFLDPLTTDLTFSTISSTNSLTNGIELNTVGGSFTVTGATNEQWGEHKRHPDHRFECHRQLCRRRYRYDRSRWNSHCQQYRHRELQRDDDNPEHIG